MRQDNPLRHWCPVLIFVLVGLLGVHAALEPLQKNADAKANDKENIQARVLIEHGIVGALLGDMRPLIAQLFFLKAYYLWEHHAMDETDFFLRVSTLLNPEKFYWLSMARITAYDIPIWRIKKQGGGGVLDLPKPLRDKINHEQAYKAIKHLEDAEAFYPGDVELLLEKAYIFQGKLKNIPQARKMYLEAHKITGKVHLGRQYAILLSDARPKEAYTFLKKLYPKSSAAQKDVTLKYIREVEKILEIPFRKRFKPPK